MFSPRELGPIRPVTWGGQPTNLGTVADSQLVPGYEDRDGYVWSHRTNQTFAVNVTNMYLFEVVVPVGIHSIEVHIPNYVSRVYPIERRQSSSMQFGADNRPISVRIDRSPEWSTFEQRAWILSLHVTVTNQTNVKKEIQSFNWNLIERSIRDADVLRHLYEKGKGVSVLLRHVVLEPGEQNSGWVFQAFPMTPDGSPPDFSFFVQVEGVQYQALP
jgi:hypothetical protein